MLERTCILSYILNAIDQRRDRRETIWSSALNHLRRKRRMKLNSLKSVLSGELWSCDNGRRVTFSRNTPNSNSKVSRRKMKCRSYNNLYKKCFSSSVESIIELMAQSLPNKKPIFFRWKLWQLLHYKSHVKNWFFKNTWEKLTLRTFFLYNFN